jgi:hypothetical protein
MSAADLHQSVFTCLSSDGGIIADGSGIVNGQKITVKIPSFHTLTDERKNGDIIKFFNCSIAYTF